MLIRKLRVTVDIERSYKRTVKNLQTEIKIVSNLGDKHPNDRHFIPGFNCFYAELQWMITCKNKY